MIGKTFENLTVVSMITVEYRGSQRTAYECICVCGATKKVLGTYLKNGHVKSCGCLKREKIGKRSLKHGFTQNGLVDPTYKCWKQMIARCENKNHNRYHRYGGRGVKICAKWRSSFKAFFGDMGACPKGMSLDRIDNDGNYEPGNCRWATRKEQANNRSSNRTFECFGKVDTLPNLSRAANMDYNTVRRRVLSRGWSVERALTTPVQKKHYSTLGKTDASAQSVA